MENNVKEIDVQEFEMYSSDIDNHIRDIRHIITSTISLIIICILIFLNYVFTLLDSYEQILNCNTRGIFTIINN